MDELDTKQVLAMILLGIFVIFLIRYLMASLKEKRFNRIVDIVSSSDFDNLTDSQKEIFIDHINLQGKQLKYSSDIYKLQMCVYGLIRFFFCAATAITLIKTLAQFGMDDVINKGLLAGIWCLGAVIFYTLFANATKNFEIALVKDKGRGY